jgi:hypothetical protein
MVLFAISGLLGPEFYKSIHMDKIEKLLSQIFKHATPLLHGHSEKVLISIGAFFVIFGTWALYPIAGRYCMSAQDILVLSQAEFFIKQTKIAAALSFAATMWAGFIIYYAK